MVYRSVEDLVSDAQEEQLHAILREALTPWLRDIIRTSPLSDMSEQDLAVIEMIQMDGLSLETASVAVNCLEPLLAAVQEHVRDRTLPHIALTA